MDDVFLKLVNLSISASWLILAVLVLRVVLKKAPKWVMPLLWGVVALRLVCLFSIESALSLIPSAETIPSEIVTETREPVLYEQATLDIVTNPTLPSAAEVPVGVSRQQAQVDFNIYSVLWLAGMAALLVHALVSAGKLKRKLATAILLRDNIYESEFVDSPFVFGVVKPNIYLPMHMDEGTAAYVIAHEHAHLARRDHWWKVLGYLVLALHWFNPLVGVAYILFCRDIELACDEKSRQGAGWRGTRGLFAGAIILRRAEKSRRGLPAGIRRGEHQNAREKRAALQKARVLGRRRGGARGRARGRVLFDESEVGARQPCLGAEAECGGRCVNRALRSGGRGGAAV